MQLIAFVAEFSFVCFRYSRKHSLRSLTRHVRVKQVLKTSALLTVRRSLECLINRQQRVVSSVVVSHGICWATPSTTNLV